MRIGLVAYAAALLLSGSELAYGQSTPPPPANDQNGAVLETVVVTATRRAENVQNVPVAVTALTANELSSSGISGVRNLTVAVPDFNGGRNFIGLQPTIRGVGSSGVSIGDEANVALYVDGVYMPVSQSNTIDLVEVDRVEVLRGPQGTLFGRNATGGLINVITPDPSFDFSGRAFGSVGVLDGGGATEEFRGYVTGGLTDTVAADFAVLYRNNDGYIRDLENGGHTGEGHEANLRGKVLWEPTTWAKITAAVAYNDDYETAINADQPVNGNTFGNKIPGTIRADEPWSVALSLPQFAETMSWSGYVKADFDLGDVSLESTTSYFHDHVLQQSDNDASPLIGAQNTTGFQDESYSQEVRLLSQGDGPFKWIAGGYYFNLTGTGNIFADTGVAPTYTTFTTAHILPDAHTKAWAGFAEGTYDLTDQLKWTLGARYSAEDRSFSINVNGHQLVNDAKAHFNQWTYRTILQWSFTNSTNIYASYSTGFKSGVFNTFGTSPTPVKPEKIDAFELGLKSDITDWLRTNIAAFYDNYTDLQVTARVPNSPLYLLQNAAKARIEGAEIEAEAIATDDLNFRFSGSILNAVYNRFPNAQEFLPVFPGGNAAVTEDVSGKEMIRAPKYTVSLTGDWGHDFEAGRLGITGTVFNSARVFYDFADRVYQPNYTLLSSEISWTLKDTSWRFSIYGTNLTNAVVYQQISTNSFADFGTLEKPREIGATVQYKF